MSNTQSRGRLALVVLLGVLAQGGARAALPGQALAQSKACMGCHQVDAKRVGPPLREVAQRYGSQDETTALVYLSTAIRQGGRGRWGAIPMPAQPHVSPSEAEDLARWVLSLQRSSALTGPEGSPALDK